MKHDNWNDDWFTYGGFEEEEEEQTQERSQLSDASAETCGIIALGIFICMVAIGIFLLAAMFIQSR